MQITLTTAQYKKLMELVYLGNWLINSYRGEERIEDYDQVAEHILSFAPAAGYKERIEFDEFEGRYYPSSKFDEELRQSIDEYDEDVFWNLLVDRLAERDLVKVFGEEKVNSMEWDEYNEKIEPFMKKYEKEIEAAGVENLQVFKAS